MTVRRALQKDMNPIMGLCGKFNTSPYTFDPNFRRLAGGEGGTAPAFAEHMLRGPNSITLVADENGVVAGFVTAAMNRTVSAVVGRNVGSILLLSVDERFRSRGVAKKLVASALKLLFHSGARLVNVITDIYNYPAIRVYESIGFRFVLSWHIYRRYRDESQDTGKALSKNVAGITVSSLDGFCEHFNRPISLLNERSIDGGKLRAHFIRNLKTSIGKGRTTAYQFYHRNRPVGLINIMEDEIARKAARTDKKIYKIMDLIVPDRESNPEVERKLLQDVFSRTQDHCMMEIWIDTGNAETILSAEKAGFHLSYTGVAYHLAR